METRFDRKQPLSERDLNRIHSATVDVLKNVGMVFDSDRAVEVFKQHGFKTEGRKVYFTAQAIEDALDTVGNEFTVLSRDPNKSYEMNRESFIVHLGGGAPFFLDYDGDRRRATTDDFVNVLKLAHSLDVIKHIRTLISPDDFPYKENEASRSYMNYLTIKHTEKPMHLGPGYGIDMLCIVLGITREKMKELAEKGFVYGDSGINPTSPLILGESQCDNLFNMAEIGMPLDISPMVTAGTTGPCTLPGVLLLQNCEIIGPMVLTQLAKPGLAIRYGTISSAADMRTLSAIYGSPEARLIELASAQIAHFYGLLSRGDVGLTDAITSDFQAGAESMFQFLNVVRSGINFLPGCGHLGSFLEGSLEKVVLDAEIAEYVTRFFRPLEFNNDNMAVDLIKKVGIQGQYMTEPHTLKHFRKEFYNPMAFSRMTYEKWMENGSKDARARAHEKVQQMLKDYERPQLDPEVEKDLDRFFKEKYPLKS